MNNTEIANAMVKEKQRGLAEVLGDHLGLGDAADPGVLGDLLVDERRLHVARADRVDRDVDGRRLERHREGSVGAGTSSGSARGAAETSTGSSGAERTDIADVEDKIVAELLAVQGHPVDIGGYYQPDDAKANSALRPSATLNDAQPADDGVPGPGLEQWGERVDLHR